MSANLNRGSVSENPGQIIDTPELLRRIPASRRTVHSWRKNGLIPFISIGGRVLFHWPSVENALVRMQRNSGN